MPSGVISPALVAVPEWLRIASGARRDRTRWEKEFTRLLDELSLEPVVGNAMEKRVSPDVLRSIGIKIPLPMTYGQAMSYFSDIAGKIPSSGLTRLSTDKGNAARAEVMRRYSSDLMPRPINLPQIEVPKLPPVPVQSIPVRRSPTLPLSAGILSLIGGLADPSYAGQYISGALGSAIQESDRQFQDDLRIQQMQQMQDAEMRRLAMQDRDDRLRAAIFNAETERMLARDAEQERLRSMRQLAESEADAEAGRVASETIEPLLLQEQAADEARRKIAMLQQMARAEEQAQRDQIRKEQNEKLNAIRILRELYGEAGKTERGFSNIGAREKMQKERLEEAARRQKYYNEEVWGRFTELQNRIDARANKKEEPQNTELTKLRAEIAKLNIQRLKTLAQLKNINSSVIQNPKDPNYQKSEDLRVKLFDEWSTINKQLQDLKAREAQLTTPIGASARGAIKPPPVFTPQAQRPVQQKPVQQKPVQQKPVQPKPVSKQSGVLKLNGKNIEFEIEDNRPPKPASQKRATPQKSSSPKQGVLNIDGKKIEFFVEK